MPRYRVKVQKLVEFTMDIEADSESDAKENVLQIVASDPIFDENVEWEVVDSAEVEP